MVKEAPTASQEFETGEERRSTNQSTKEKIMNDRDIEIKSSRADLFIGEITLSEFSQLKAENIILPELTGSEKQVEWATTIRAEWLSVIDEYIAQATENVNYLTRKGRDAQGGFDEHVDRVNRAIAGCSLISSSATWIQQLKTPSVNDISAPLLAYIVAGGEIKDGAAWADFYRD
jgi:hypothetical protein